MPFLCFLLPHITCRTNIMIVFVQFNEKNNVSILQLWSASTLVTVTHFVPTNIQYSTIGSSICTIQLGSVKHRTMEHFS